MTLPSGRAEAEVPLVWRAGDVILGLYEVIAVAGTGGMGVVYRVRHLGWDMDLAVKVPRVEFCANETQLRAFERECEAWVEMGLHAHTVTCVYVRRLGGVPRVFAEWVDGGTLAQWVSRRRLYEGGPQGALRRMLDIAIQVAWGVEHAHGQGMIHQDIKPANVMVTVDGIAKVTDFGLVGTGGRTLAYCSPEQATPGGAGHLTPATDVWSWALSVLELFVGGPPCRYGQTAAEVLARFVETGTAEVPIPALPHKLAALLARCFRLDPADRPGTMSEVADALVELYEEALGEAWPRTRPDASRLMADGLSNQALSLLDLGHAAEAEAVLERALRSDPLNPHAVYNAGLYRWRSGRASDAELVADLEAVRVSHPAASTATHLLGLVHLEQGDRDAARKALTEAARQAPADPDITAALRLAKGPGEPPLPATLPGGSVNAVALSGDGRVALSAGGVDVQVGDRTYSTVGGVRVWEVRTGRQLGRLVGREFTSVALSADASLAVSASSDGGTVRVWEPRSGRCLHVLEGHTGAARAVAVSDDGSVAVSGGDDATVHVWDPGRGTSLRTLNGHQGTVMAVAVSRQSLSAVSGGLDGTLRVWGLASVGAQRLVIDAHTRGVSSVAMSADGRVAVSCCGDRGGGGDPIVRVWDLVSGRCLYALEGHARAVLSVAVSADASLAISASIDGTARLWDLASGRCLRVLHALTDGVASVSTSFDGGVAVYGAASILCRDDVHSVGVWDLRAGPRSPWSYSRPRPTTELDRTALAVQEALRRAGAFLETRDFAAAAAQLGAARDLPGHERYPELLEGWSRVARGGCRAALRSSWTGRVLTGHADRVTAGALGATGEHVLTGGDDGKVGFWEAATGRCVRMVAGHADVVSSLAISNDGRRAVSCAGDPVNPYQASGGDVTVRVWEPTGRLLHTLEGHTSGVLSVALSSDGRQALSGSNDGTARLWDLEAGQCLRTLAAGSGVRSVALSADGRVALLGGGLGEAPVFDLDSGRSRRTLVADSLVADGGESGFGFVGPVALSADGRLALAGGSGGAIQVWELASGRRLCTLAGHGELVGVTSMALSLDAKFALSADRNGVVRVWDLQTGECLRLLGRHRGWVHAVSLTADGRRALSVSDDGTARLWELDWDYEFPALASWDEGASPYLRSARASSRAAGHEHCDEEEIGRLLGVLQAAGYGWLREEGVRAELERMGNRRGRRSWRGRRD